jgi:sporulation protein YlmC with PRC-barrel domain
MKKRLMVLTFVLIAALALSACEPADDAALTDAERTATAEAGVGVEPTPGLEDPAVPPADPGVPPVDPEPIDPPADPDVELTPTPDTAVDPDVDATPTPDTAVVDEDDRAEIYRLSNVIDWNVRDQQGEDVGSVHSFIVDQQTGYIHYVLIDPDGDLDIDGDAVAIPWNALSVSHLDAMAVGVPGQVSTPENDDAVTPEPGTAQETPVVTDRETVLDDDPHFVLTIDRQALVNAPVIEDLDEVDFASPQWQDENVRYWDTHLAGLPVTGDMEADADLQNPLHLDDVTGYDIYNPEGDQIADVAEMILNPETGEITHIVAGVGGFLGLGERYVPIPFQSFEYDAEEERFILQATEDELENAPGYDSMDDLRADQPNWGDEYNQYWGVEPGMQAAAASGRRARSYSCTVTTTYSDCSR